MSESQLDKELHKALKELKETEKTAYRYGWVEMLNGSLYRISTENGKGVCELMEKPFSERCATHA